jgi:hypothetical protein
MIGAAAASRRSRKAMPTERNPCSLHIVRISTAACNVSTRPSTTQATGLSTACDESFWVHDCGLTAAVRHGQPKARFITGIPPSTRRSDLGQYHFVHADGVSAQDKPLLGFGCLQGNCS